MHIKLSESGRKSVNAQKDTRRSKNEILFCKLCEDHFSKVTHNEPLFNNWDADVLIHDLNIAVLWNGIWHYKQIIKNQSLEQIQNRDKIKISEITEFGWTPYIIKDMGQYNEKFVRSEFEKFLEYVNNKRN